MRDFLPGRVDQVHESAYNLLIPFGAALVKIDGPVRVALKRLPDARCRCRVCVMKVNLRKMELT